MKPLHWYLYVSLCRCSARGIFCAAFFRGSQREVVSVDTRLPCRLSQQPKEHTRRSRCCSRAGGIEGHRARRSTRKGTVAPGAVQPLDEGSGSGAAAAAAPAEAEGTQPDAAVAGQQSHHAHLGGTKQKNKRGERCSVDPAHTQADGADSPVEFA